MDASVRMLLGLLIGIVVMVILVSKTKVHTFIALMIAAIITGVIGGMPLVDIKTDETTVTGLVTAIKDGFGNTLKSTGIIIGLGVMMGGTLEKSGAAEKNGLFIYQSSRKEKRRMGSCNYRVVYCNPGICRFCNCNFCTAL